MSLSQNGPLYGSESSSTQAVQIRTIKEEPTQKSEGNSGGREKGRIQAPEHISDDNESISSSLSEPLPTDEQPPQAVDVNRDGFQARATAAGELELLISLTRSRLYA